MATTYGTNHIGTAHAAIDTLMDALVTTMASGYDPAISYVYGKHATAKLQLNAVSIQLDTDPMVDFGVSTGTLVDHQIVFSIRVHTAYAGGIHDGTKNRRLLNSVINKLKANEELGSSYWIANIEIVSVDSEFEDSATIGGELMVTVTYMATYTQE